MAERDPFCLGPSPLHRLSINSRFHGKKACFLCLLQFVTKMAWMAQWGGISRLSLGSGAGFWECLRGAVGVSEGSGHKIGQGRVDEISKWEKPQRVQCRHENSIGRALLLSFRVRDRPPS